MRAPVVLDSCQHLVVLVFWIFATLIGSSSIKLLLNLQSLNNVQVGFRKSRGTRDQIANIHGIIKKAREFQKNIYFCFIDYAKAFDCVDHKKLWEILFPNMTSYRSHITESKNTLILSKTRIF